jgi:hypothetical protein
MVVEFRDCLDPFFLDRWGGFELVKLEFIAKISSSYSTSFLYACLVCVECLEVWL